MPKRFLTGEKGFFEMSVSNDLLGPIERNL